jgi:hypothetical protein
MLCVRLYRHLIIPALALLVSVPAVHAQTRSTGIVTTADRPVAISISFGEFFAASKSELQPSTKLQGLSGKRVKLVGFMAQMEVKPEGSFFLVPSPVFCDEEGGGNADLPPGSVLVVVPSLADRKIPFVSGLLEVTGVLSLGNQEKNGQVTAIRLMLDQADDQFPKLNKERNP